jgi:hypothetical protein
VAVHGGSMTAARRHSGSEWAEEGKGLFTGGGGVLLLYSVEARAARRRDCGRHGGGGEAMGTAKWWQPRLECHWCGLGTDIRTVRLMGGPHTILIFFQFIENRLKF